MWDAIEKGKYMADIISGKSRFNGDRNAPVKKVISINREMQHQQKIMKMFWMKLL